MTIVLHFDGGPLDGADERIREDGLTPGKPVISQLTHAESGHVHVYESEEPFHGAEDILLHHTRAWKGVPEGVLATCDGCGCQVILRTDDRSGRDLQNDEGRMVEVFCEPCAAADEGKPVCDECGAVLSHEDEVYAATLCTRCYLRGGAAGLCPKCEESECQCDYDYCAHCGVALVGTESRYCDECEAKWGN
jgi:hypothetical protein